MKNSVLEFGFISILLITAFTSCSKDNETTESNNTSFIEGSSAQNLVINGTITEDLTLNSLFDYEVTGILTITNGATLTIPAGTTITATGDDSTENYIHIDQGSFIDVQGEVDNPVIMTSTSGESGSWGGLIITGNAETTAGINAIAEVGDLTYGGTSPTDSSGSIKNLVIIGSGAIINDESQFNGLTLYAVGSGTTIENVAILDGEDDGVEFFGGSAEVTNLYIEGAEDDSIDWTEGWNGAVTNAYIAHNSAFSTAIEADGVNNNPTLTNITAVSTTGTDGVALQFKSLSGATINGLTLTGYSTQFDFVGSSTVEDVIVDNATASETTTYSSSTIDFSTITFLATLMQ